MKCCIVTLGCQMNRSDSERLQAVIEGMGFEMTDKEEDADLIGVVACSVRQKSIDKVYARIHKWNRWKARRPLITFVSGCILPADEAKFLKLFDLVFRMHELPRLPELLRQCGVVTSAPAVLERVRPRDGRTEFWQVEPAFRSPFEGFVPIQNGCDKFCTYCAVPYTRGREISRPSAEVLDEVERMVERGMKSITLLGQNVNSYGLDRKGAERTFPELLEAVAERVEASGREVWVYYTSPHPRDMTREVVEVMARHRCIARQVHLPLQSGSDSVLKRMNRGYSLADYRRIVETIRELLPDATLFTDIIVGFCGETEEEFAATERAMEEFAFNMAYVAKYSPRPGARAAEWPDDIPPAVKSERLARLGRILERTAGAWNERLIGRTVRVLIERPDPRVEGALAGRTEGRIPVRVFDADVPPGAFLDVRIESAASLSLSGRPVKD